MKNKNKQQMVETAKDVYNKKQKEISELLKKIRVNMQTHKKKFKKNESNWGYVGDLSRITTQLKEIENIGS